MTARIQRLTEEEFHAALKKKGRSKARTRTVDKYDLLLADIPDGQAVRIAVTDDELNVRSLSLRLAHAARRAGRSITVRAIDDAHVVAQFTTKGE